MRRQGSVFYNTLALTAVDLLLRGLGVLFQRWLSGQIGAAGIGLLQLVGSVGGLAMTLGLSGIRTTAMYLCAEEHGAGRLGGVRRAVRLCLGYTLVCSVLAAALLLFSADTLARAWLHAPQTAPALRLLAIGLPLRCALSVCAGYFTACGGLRRLIAAEVAEQLAAVLLSALLLRMWAGTDGARAICALTAAGLLAALLPAIWLGWTLRRELRVCGAPEDARLFRRMLRLCLPLALGEYLRTGLRTLEQLLIPRGLARFARAEGQGLAAYGTICGMVFPILMLPAAPLFALSELLVPELARCRAVGGQARIRRICRRSLRLGLLYAACVGALLYLSAPELGALIYKSGEAGRYLRLFAPLTPMLYADAIVDAMCKGLGQQTRCVRNNTITSVLDVALLYVLLPRLGVRGYLISFTVTHAVNFYLSLVLLLNAAQWTVRWGFALRLGVSVAAPAALCMYLPLQSGAPAAVLRCAVFLVLHLLLARGLALPDKGERAWLGRTLRDGGRNAA